MNIPGIEGLGTQMNGSRMAPTCIGCADSKISMTAMATAIGAQMHESGLGKFQTAIERSGSSRGL